MYGSLSKYFGTPSDPKGNQLFWGQPGELPFRGPQIPELLKSEEVEQLPHVYDAKSELLKLPNDAERYNEIIDKCANGWWHLRHEKFNNNSDGTINVFVAWLEIYGEVPATKRPGLESMQ